MHFELQISKRATLAFVTCLTAFSVSSVAIADGPAGNPKDQAAKFRQLEPELPTPNIFRTASGAPGPLYWQQTVDYVIDVELDEAKKRLIASEAITYTNNSPDTLSYLWVSLDQNRFKDGSMARTSEVASAAGTRRDNSGSGDSYSFSALRRAQAFAERPHGYEIKSVRDATNRDMSYTINDTMMRIDLARPLAPEETVKFSIAWAHNIIDEAAIGGRGGYEHFPKTDTHLYGIAQWFPRLAAYTDYTGWQNKQFLGRGEFTLEFGDYEVNITVPDDHIVSATGVLTNPREVLTAEQRNRLSKANEKSPIFIVTPEEARENEKEASTKNTTWKFKAENVRDFAWSSSNKYIWDAMIFKQDDAAFPEVLAMSFYPNEAEPIWSQYSTQAVVHTMDVYNKFAFKYPYPTAQSVNSWERGGMEYPMITFNGYRPSEDEKSGEIVYSRNIKYGLIGVIIHEIGHIYFPMVVNSDERRWTWMDEGLNTFLEYMAEYEWEENFPIIRGMQNPLDQISQYMTSSNQVPIMTQSDSILQFGPNAYSKPAASLIVLRETVMGRELFDFAFREYATRWKFKRPTPADFFRTMEDASAVDLDWFWRGWYFGTDHVDIALTGMREYQISSQDPDKEFKTDREDDAKDYPENIVQRRNREEGLTTRVSRLKELNDFYNENDKFTPTNKDRNTYQSFLSDLEDWERAAYEKALEDEQYLYFVDFENIGGLVSPLPLTLTFENGKTEKMMIPAEIWRRNPDTITKLIIRDRKITSIELDAEHQTADADYNNNSFPPKIRPSRLELYKSSASAKNLMADMLVEIQAEEKDKVMGETEVPLSSETGTENENRSNSDNAKPLPDTKPSNSKDMSDKDKSALRRTLDRLMGNQ